MGSVLTLVMCPLRRKVQILSKGPYPLNLQRSKSPIFLKRDSMLLLSTEKVDNIPHDINSYDVSIGPKCWLLLSEYFSYKSGCHGFKINKIEHQDTTVLVYKYADYTRELALFEKFVLVPFTLHFSYLRAPCCL